MEEKIAIIEAIIFASEAPLTVERMAEIMPDTEKKEIIALLEKVVRENLGRAKPGEVVYRVVPADTKKTGSETAEKRDTVSVSAT